jgi:hypothetical protein
MVDDGSIWNGTRFGGIDPSISPISDLGRGVFTVSGVMKDSHNRFLAPSRAVPDTQFLFVNYPAALVTSMLAPNLASSPALPAVSALTGVPVAVLGDSCSVGGLLAILCGIEPWSVPATFSALCPLILG